MAVAVVRTLQEAGGVRETDTKNRFIWQGKTGVKTVCWHAKVRTPAAAAAALNAHGEIQANPI